MKKPINMKYNINIYYIDIETSIDGDFIIGVIMRENDGKIFILKTAYAFTEFCINNEGVYFGHFAGGFDYLFIVEECLKRGIKFDLSVISSLIFRLRINKSVFYDTYFLMPDSLDRLGKIFGYKKEKIEYNKIEEYSKEIENACINHTEILLNIHNSFCDFFGIDKTKIFSVSSLSHKILSNYYDLKKLKLDLASNNFYRHFYYGGRCEIFRFYGDNVNIYDVNSLYPFCMKKVFPVGKISEGKKINKNTFLIHCRVNINRYIPPIPYRYEKKLYFLNGEFDCFIYRPEFDLLSEKEIIKIYSCFNSESQEKIFCNFIDDLYKKRQEGEIKNYLYKKILNSSYGKFAQLETKTIITNSEKNLKLKNEITQGVYEYELLSEYKYQNTIIAGLTTSYGRSVLYNFFQDINFNLCYCDTDSIFTEEKMKTGDNIGELKQEFKKGCFEILQPKVYRIENKESKKIRMKGFYKDLINIENFKKIKNKDNLKTKKYKKLKGVLRSGVFGVENVIKSIKQEYNKRKKINENETIPFLFSEVVK